MMRFNKDYKFNVPYGHKPKRFAKAYVTKIVNQVIHLEELLKHYEWTFLCQPFEDTIHAANNKDFIYCDPPYLITTAGYNENGMWTDKEEKDLLNFLKELDKKGLKFALSNVLESKNKENKILKDWILENNFYCNYLKKDYSNSNYQRKAKNSISVEVLVTNYNTDEM